MSQCNILLTLMSLQIGGAETHAVELAKGLTKRGYKVTVASFGGIFEKELAKNNIKHYQVPLHNKKIKNVWRSYKELQKIIAREKIDLVHAHSRIPAVICGAVTKKMGIPFVTTSHGIRATGLIWKYLTNWGQKTVAVSEDVKKNLIEVYGVKPEDIVLTINGIDTEKFSPKALGREGFDPKTKKLVYVSRLDSDRKEIVEQIIEASEKIKKNYPDFEAIIVGNGDVYPLLFEKARVINEKFGEKVIKLTGETAETNEYVALADVFVGFGRSGLEALAGGKPVILASSYGYTGLFREEELSICLDNNFSCRGEEPVVIDKMVQDVLNIFSLSEEEIKKIKDYGRALIIERYSTERMTGDNIAAYDQLLGGSKCMM